MKKTVYQTDANGVYLFPLIANELALAQGFFNIPYGAYEDEPPPASDGKLVRRSQDAWELAEDHRRASLWLTGTGESYACLLYTSIERKIELKREMLDKYGDYVHGVLTADKGGQDEVVVTVMVWLLDTLQFRPALDLAAYVRCV